MKLSFKDKKNDSNNDIEMNNSKKDNEKESSDEEKKEMNNDNASLKKPKIKDKILNNNNKSLDNEVNRPRKKQSMKERIVNSIISGITEGESYLNPQNNVEEKIMLKRIWKRKLRINPMMKNHLFMKLTMIIWQNQMMIIRKWK